MIKSVKSPSNKKDGSSYLDTFTKDKLKERYIDLASQISEMESEIKELEEENIDLKKQLETYKRKLNRFNTPEKIVKKILEYRARNYSPIFIRDKLKLEGIDYDLKSIKDIINGDLDTSLELYFNKCKQEYSESIKINTNFYKQSSIDEFQRLIDSAYEDLENCDKEDIKMRDSIRNSIGKLIGQRDVLMKNIDEASEMNEEDTLAEEATQKWSNDSEDGIVNLYQYIKENNNNVQ